MLSRNIGVRRGKPHLIFNKDMNVIIPSLQIRYCKSNLLQGGGRERRRFTNILKAFKVVFVSDIPENSQVRFKEKKKS